MIDIENGQRCTNCGGIVSHAPDCFEWLGDDELEELIEDAKLELDRRRRFRGWYDGVEGDST